MTFSEVSNKMLYSFETAKCQKCSQGPNENSTIDSALLALIVYDCRDSVE